MTPQEMVLEFHRTYNLPIGDSPTVEEQDGISSDIIELRLKLIHEELTELEDALVTRDLVETAVALGDLLYVVYGAAIVFGINLDQIVEEVHRSNMTKLDSDGKVLVRDDGKVLKGPNFEEPDLSLVLAGQDPLLKETCSHPRVEDIGPGEVQSVRCVDCGMVRSRWVSNSIPGFGLV